jgi:hypothetical protein
VNTDNTPGAGELGQGEAPQPKIVNPGFATELLNDWMTITMKRLLTVLLVGAALLFLSSTGLAREIHFKKGQTSQKIKGRYGSNINSYTFQARKGQKLSVAIKSAKGQNGTLTVTISSYCGEEYALPLPSANRVQNWSGPLPCSDKYAIDVLTSADGVTDDRPLNENYTLQLRIR